MRVCVLIPVLDAYKGSNHLPLLRALPEVQFTILTNRTKPATPDLPPNVEIITLGGRNGPYYYGVSDWLFARSVLGRYPAHDLFWRSFDVIHLNQTMGPALRALRETGVPLLFTIHHPVTVDREVAVEESGFLAGIVWKAKYWNLVRWQRSLCRSATRVMTVSKTVAERLVQDYGISPEKISIVPNGVDGEVFTPADSSECEYDVLSLGSFLHPRKGFPYLLEVYRALDRKGLRIADVGRRSEAQCVALASLPHVRRFGTVAEETLVSLIQRSATLVSTSLYEGFGLSLIEALACGRPAFAFDAGAIGEVLRPIDPSLVVGLCDVRSLVARIESFLVLAESERRAKGAQFREAVLQRYPLQLSASQLRQLYERLSAP